MKRNWRGHAARVQYYFEQGSLSLNQFKSALYASAALKIILELSVVTAVLITPLVFCAMFIWGVIWIRYGWYKQLSEVGTLDAVTPLGAWGMYMQVEIPKALGVKLNGYDLTKPPQELRDVLSSVRKEPQ